MRQLRHRGRAVRAEDQLRRFHLDLEPQAAGGQRVDLLQPGHGVVHRLHLGHGGDLGQGEDQPFRQLAGGGQAGDEQVQGAQPAGTGGRLEALEPDPDERRGAAVRDGGGDGGRGSDGVGVLGVVTPVPVAVLEVQPEVLDRLAAELRGHAGGDGGGQVRGPGRAVLRAVPARRGRRRQPAPGRPSRRRSPE